MSLTKRCAEMEPAVLLTAYCVALACIVWISIGGTATQRSQSGAYDAKVRDARDGWAARRDAMQRTSVLPGGVRMRFQERLP